MIAAGHALFSVVTHWSALRAAAVDRWNSMRGAGGATDLAWDDEALARLKKVPFFVRGHVLKKVEEYAQGKGLKKVSDATFLACKKSAGR